MVHIDPEDDLQAKPNAHLPGRPDLLARLAEQLGDATLPNKRVVFHYLDGKVDAEIYLAATRQQAETLQMRCDTLTRNDDIFRAIHIHWDIPPHAQD